MTETLEVKKKKESYLPYLRDNKVDFVVPVGTTKSIMYLLGGRFQPHRRRKVLTIIVFQSSHGLALKVMSFSLWGVFEQILIFQDC